MEPNHLQISTETLPTFVTTFEENQPSEIQTPKENPWSSEFTEQALQTVHTQCGSFSSTSTDPNSPLSLPASSPASPLSSGLDEDTIAKHDEGKPCLICKQAHTACDRGRPCSRCQRLGKAHQCQDPPVKKRGRPLGSAENHQMSKRKRSCPENITSFSSATALSTPHSAPGSMSSLATPPTFLSRSDSTPAIALLQQPCFSAPTLSTTPLIPSPVPSVSVSLATASEDKEEMSIVLNKNVQIIVATPAFCRAIGSGLKDLLRTDWIKLIPEWLLDNFCAEWNKMLHQLNRRDVKQCSDVCGYLKTRDGTILSLSARESIFIQDSQIVGISLKFNELVPASMSVEELKQYGKWVRLPITPVLSYPLNSNPNPMSNLNYYTTTATSSVIQTPSLVYQQQQSQIPQQIPLQPQPSQPSFIPTPTNYTTQPQIPLQPQLSQPSFIPTPTSYTSNGFNNEMKMSSDWNTVGLANTFDCNNQSQKSSANWKNTLISLPIHPMSS